MKHEKATANQTGAGEKLDQVIRARVEPALKTRLTQYRRRKDVKRSEAFVVRESVVEFLAARETSTKVAA